MMKKGDYDEEGGREEDDQVWIRWGREVSKWWEGEEDDGGGGDDLSSPVPPL